MSVQVTKLLQNIPLFSALDSEALNEISGFFKGKIYRSGEVLFQEDTIGDALYIIVDGKIEIIKKGEKNLRGTTLALRRNGDILGEMSLLDKVPRFASAKAVEDTKVLELSRSDFLTILRNHPLIAYQIMKVLSSRVRQTDLHMLDELRKKNKELQIAYNKLQASAQALKKSNLDLNNTKSFLERIISTAPYSIIVTESDDTISLFNDTAEKEYRYSSKEVIGKKVEMLRGRANLLNLDELIWEDLKNKGMWRGEIIAQRKDGEHFVTHTIISRLLDHMGHTSAIIHLSKDITTERTLTTQALELERMATRGQMAAEVAHELNNYMQLVLGNLDLLPMESKKEFSNRFQERVDAMRCELEKISSFIHSLMDFAMPESTKIPLDFINFIQKELFFLRPQNRYDNITFKTHFDQNIPLIEADPGQMQQLFYNLLNNAADALKEVSNRKKIIDLEIRYLPDEKQIEIEVTDNGTGVNKKDLDKMLKQRFTTKRKGHGFGLLSVRRVVENHRGTIKVQSQEGKGTTFTVRIPVKQQKLNQDQKSSSAQQPVCQKS